MVIAQPKSQPTQVFIVFFGKSAHSVASAAASARRPPAKSRRDTNARRIRVVGKSINNSEEMWQKQRVEGYTTSI
jgi:hypothetical protein